MGGGGVTTGGTEEGEARGQEGTRQFRAQCTSWKEPFNTSACVACMHGRGRLHGDWWCCGGVGGWVGGIRPLPPWHRHRKQGARQDFRPPGNRAANGLAVPAPARTCVLGLKGRFVREQSGFKTPGPHLCPRLDHVAALGLIPWPPPPAGGLGGRPPALASDPPRPSCPPAPTAQGLSAPAPGFSTPLGPTAACVCVCVRV